MFAVLQFGDCWARTEAPITPARILIADEHEAAQNAIRSELHRRHNLKVCGEASNGKDAVQQARSLNPDLIILDVFVRLRSQLLGNNPEWLAKEW
jgi:PleD family two-component response regulator